EAMRDVSFGLRGPGFLELNGIDPMLHDAARLWITDDVQLFEDGRRLGNGRIVSTRVSLPSDRSFESYQRALEHVTGAPLPVTTDIAWQQAMLDVLVEYPITSDRSAFSINPRLARLGVRTTTALRFFAAVGAERAYEYIGDPGVVHL